MVWNTLKLGAHLVKRNLFWICNSGTVALFWSDSWDGYPPLLSSHPHLQSLCDHFLSARWNKVAHYKEAYNMVLMWVTDGKILLIGRWVALWGISWNYLRYGF